jgi:hypothetical protein
MSVIGVWHSLHYGGIGCSFDCPGKRNFKKPLDPFTSNFIQLPSLQFQIKLTKNKQRWTWRCLTLKIWLKKRLRPPDLITTRHIDFLWLIIRKAKLINLHFQSFFFNFQRKFNVLDVLIQRFSNVKFQFLLIEKRALINFTHFWIEALFSRAWGIIRWKNCRNQNVSSFLFRYKIPPLYVGWRELYLSCYQYLSFGLSNKGMSWLAGRKKERINAKIYSPVVATSCNTRQINYYRLFHRNSSRESQSGWFGMDLFLSFGLQSSF